MAPQTIIISKYLLHFIIKQAFMAKTDILNQFDNSKKHGIVTDEELLQRGVIYDSRGRIEEDLRGVSENYRNTEKTGVKNLFTNGRSIPIATSLVEETRIKE